MANIKTIFISFDLEILLLGMWPRETLAPVPKGMCKGELFVRGKIKNLRKLKIFNFLKFKLKNFKIKYLNTHQ